MSQRDGFAGGFIVGAIVGGIVGGVLGTVLSSRKGNKISDRDDSLLKQGTEFNLNTEEGMELARRNLEEKIAQLNLAIDDVRQKLGPTNGHSPEQ